MSVFDLQTLVYETDPFSPSILTSVPLVIILVTLGILTIHGIPSCLNIPAP